MSKYRPILKAPRAPKGGDIDEMLKFIHEQKEKPSEAAKWAQKLEDHSSVSKSRQKNIELAKTYMEGLRKLAYDVDVAKQHVTGSLIDLSAVLPELPDLLKYEADLVQQTTKDIDKAVGYIERMQNLFTHQKNRQTIDLFRSVHDSFNDHIVIFDFPDAYDSIVSIVESTRINNSKTIEYDISGVNEEWKQRIEDQISVFKGLETEMRQKFHDWLVTNGYNPESKFGGWEEYDHQRFLLTGCGSVNIEFKDKTYEEIIRHKDWHIHKQFLKRKIRSLRIELQKRINQLKADANQESINNERKRLQQMEIEERRARLFEDKKALESVLTVEREEKLKRDNEKKMKTLLEQQNKMAEQMKLKDKAEKDRALLKSKVQLEKEKKVALEEKNRQIRMAQLEKEKEYQKVHQKVVKDNVNNRMEIEKQKKMKKDEDIKEKLIQESIRQERLDALAKSVRDEFGLDELEANPEKLTKLNEIRRNAEKEEEGLFKMTSFPSHLIEADPRVRVENALREAGLIDSAYARTVINQMSALRPSPGMQSHIKFSGN